MIHFTAYSIEKQLIEANNELKGVVDYPDEKLLKIIKEVGFECDLCGRCCTKEFNDHIFLLDRDTARIKDIDSSALIPAPYYEFCDQNGKFYVSGFALNTRPDGSCVFLISGRCEIYDMRPAICRLYPYMLHREADESGNIEWRQISGLNEHGNYHTEIDNTGCERIADAIKKYETEYLKQKIRFLRKVQKHFKTNGLKHVQRIYDRQMREFLKGGEIEVFVFFEGDFESVNYSPLTHGASCFIL